MRLRIVVRRTAGLLAGSIALAGCAPSHSARPVATDRVDLPRSYRYAPAEITVRAGTRVTWTNHDVFTHAVHLLDDNDTTMVMKPGDSTAFVFARPGLHRYNCSFHLQMMQGAVEVTAPAGAGSPP